MNVASESKRLRVTEIFRSLQGEGPSLGLPATFLRLAGCNLACRYCDTPYTWDGDRYDLGAESCWYSVPDALEALLATTPSRIVITGGEPLLQQDALAELLGLVPPEVAIEVETNATLRPFLALKHRVAQWNLSPKLASAELEPPVTDWRERLLEWHDVPTAYLKFVIATQVDLLEADALVDGLDWPKSRVVLMPEGRNPARLADLSPFVAEAALERGYRFTTRLHVLLWGDERGR